FSVYLIVLLCEGSGCSEIGASISGSLQNIGNEIYYDGYSQELKDRLEGFYCGLCALRFLEIYKLISTFQAEVDKHLSTRLI
uniref:Malate synthase-like n=1 Tax=Cyprinus carpio TaxID=7962 RepID=A0A8C2G6Q3_CYPCA